METDNFNPKHTRDKSKNGHWIAYTKKVPRTFSLAENMTVLTNNIATLVP